MGSGAFLVKVKLGDQVFTPFEAIMKTNHNCSERGSSSLLEGSLTTQLAGPASALLEVNLLASAMLCIVDLTNWQMPDLFSQPAPIRLITLMILSHVGLMLLGPQRTQPQKLGMLWVGLGLIGFSLVLISVSNLLLDRPTEFTKLLELPDRDGEFNTMSSKVTLVACLFGWIVSYGSKKAWKRWITS